MDKNTSETKQAFIKDTRGILNGQITREDQLSPGQNGLVKSSKDLLRAFLDKGLPSFMEVFNDMAKAQPVVDGWRQEIGIPQEPEQEEEPVGTLLSDVTPTSIKWLWYGKLAFGKLQMFDGAPDLGKSTIIDDLIARASRGWAFPGEQDGQDPIGSVIITTEEDISDTIQPKLSAAHADLTRINSIGLFGDKKKPTIFKLEPHLDVLEKAIRRVEAKIIFIDPLMTVLGSKRNTFLDNEVRDALMPLVLLAQNYGACVICLRHTAKGSAGEKLMNQGIGSIGFAGTARLCLMAIEHPEDENQGIFFTPKNNLIPKSERTKLVYTIVPSPTNPAIPIVKWLGTTTITDQELMHPHQETYGSPRNMIFAYLKGCSPIGKSAQDIANALGLKVDTVSTYLGRMHKDGQIQKKERGLYYA